MPSFDRVNTIIICATVLVAVALVTVLAVRGNNHADDVRRDRTRAKTEACKTIENETARVLCIQGS